MMPTFPPPPLSFRTVSFPQYGWKVGLSGSAFPHVTQVKPAPGIPCVSRRFASALRALRCHTLRPALCRNSGLGGALPFEKISPLSQRSSLRSGFYCPGPSSLIRPHPPHSPFPLGMPFSAIAGNPLAVCAQFLRQRHWPSPEVERLGTPKKPHHPLQMGRTFAASPVRYSLQPAKLLATLADLTGYFSQPSVAFTSRLSTGRSPFPPLDITTVATEQVPPAGLSPAGTSASIAAPTPFRMTRTDTCHGGGCGGNVLAANLAWCKPSHTWPPSRRLLTHAPCRLQWRSCVHKFPSECRRAGFCRPRHFG